MKVTNVCLRDVRGYLFCPPPGEKLESAPVNYVYVSICDFRKNTKLGREEVFFKYRNIGTPWFGYDAVNQFILNSKSNRMK